MNLSTIFCRILVLTLGLACANHSAYCYEQMAVDTFPNYVVIGAFAKQKNAVKFTEHARKDLSLNAIFEINPNRNLYYVYCLTTSEVDQAISMAKQLRDNPELSDAWVYHGILGKGKANLKSIDINPNTKQQIRIEAKEGNDFAGGNGKLENTEAKSLVVEEKELVNNSETKETKIEDATVKTEPEPSTNKEVETKAKPDADEDVNGKGFVFKLIRFVDQAEVKGEVDVIDPDKAKKLASYEGNRSVKVSPLKNKSGQVTFATEVFGYRKMQRDVDFNNPTAEDIQVDENGNTIIPFELVRLQKGDFAIMYNVYFFRDAAIMRPESRYEVNSLVEMLKENPKYIIKIHGHTNGNHAGNISYRDKNTTDFFTINGSKDGYGSAKELSRARAEEIRDYLINQGIDPARTSIKAWGGKKAIHDKHSARAQENVRVEIEILEDK